MSAADKIENAGQDVKGKVKEGVGKATGDEQTQAEGQADQAKAGIKKTGEKVKDAASDAVDAVKDKVNDAKN